MELTCRTLLVKPVPVVLKISSRCAERLREKNRDTMIFAGNLIKLGLFLALTLIRFPGQCMGTSFDLGTSSYYCNSTLKCLGDAHRYEREPNGSVNGNADGNFTGKLSLIQETGAPNGRLGIAYYNQSIRMLNPSTNLAASFNTTFAFAQSEGSWNDSVYYGGGGMAFVVSSDSVTLGGIGADLGYFDAKGKDLRDKSVVVEFDNYDNGWDPDHNLNDIGPNHVGFDIGSLLSVTSQLATCVDIQFKDPSTVYAWIEYSADTQQLELRISHTMSRPQHALLFYKMDLFEVVDEYMYVGFSAATADHYSYFYVWNWTFESYFTTPPSSNFTTLPPSQSRDTRNLITGLSVGLVSVAVIGGCCFFVLARRRRRKRRSWQQLSDADGLTSKLTSMIEKYHFTYEQLSGATGGFPETAKLGRGGFGSVYRGVLPDGNVPIAVKRIDAESSQGEREFMAEVCTISQLRHRNLIQLLGWCKDRDKLMIVYELMRHGSLDQHLFNPGSVPLSWSQRHNVLRGTAAAIEYLHQGWKQRVIHRDIKPSNIMLDDEWNAKLGDFGLARLVDHLRTAAMTDIVGTVGYIAPEAIASGKFTEKTDIFAFGVVAIEVATGRKSLQPPEDEILLVDWVWRKLTEGRLLSVVDERLGADYDVQTMEAVLRIGLLCCHPNPEARPPMRQVMQILAGDVPVPEVPQSKPAPEFRAMVHRLLLGLDSQTLHSGGMNIHSSQSRSMDRHSSQSSPFYSTAWTHSTGNSNTDSSTATSSNSNFKVHSRSFQLERSKSQ